MPQRSTATSSRARDGDWLPRTEVLTAAHVIADSRYLQALGRSWAQEHQETIDLHL